MRHRLRALLVVVACTVAAAARPEPRPGNDTVDEANVGWAQPRGRNQKIGQSWLQLHDGLVKEVAEWDAQSGLDLLFLGDSIMESWRGTFMGMSWSPFSNVPALFKTAFGAYDAAALAIAGDKAEHLMWRLMNGELPTQHSPKVIVLHIGTNDLAGKVCQPGSQDTTPDASIQHMVRFLLDKYPTAHVVILGVLPKGSQWPNSCTPAQQRLNGALQQFAEEIPRVHFLDVSTQFLLTDASGRQEINPMLLPDTLHPSLKGMQIIAEALRPVVKDLFLASGGTFREATVQPPPAEVMQDEDYTDS